MLHRGLGVFLAGLVMAAAAGAAERGITAQVVAPTAKRVALVIGNDRYETLPALNNAGKDARDVASRLGDLGFEVILKTDAGARDVARALAEFEGKLGGAEAGLVFYAGHGIQSAGRNYLIPSDARIELEEDLRFEGIESSEFLDTMARAGAAVNILIIDACRDNPLPRRTRSAARGLTAVPVPAGLKGTAILYSAGPGQTAEDGPKGGNGVFTGALLAALDRPGQSVEQVFKDTARRVAEVTGGRQTPWNNSSLTGDFYFRSAVPASPAAEGGNGASGAEVVLWQSIQGSNNPAMFDAYLKRYPNGVFADVARIRRDELSGPQVASRPPVAEPIPVGPSRDLIREVQGLLNDLGYGVGAADGIAGSRTEGAVRAFQSAGGLRANGEIDETLAAALRRAVAERQTASLPPASVPAPSPPPAPVTTVPSATRSLKPGDTFLDCEGARAATADSSLPGVFCGPEMVVVPAGSFEMGSRENEKGRDKDEGPRHRVTIPRPFAVARFEVTRGQYGAFARETGRTDGDWCLILDGVAGEWKKDTAKSWRIPGFPQTDDHPAVCVNWYDAREYTKWLSSRTGREYRLLSESEWEYAARAGTGTERYWGDDYVNWDACHHANVGDRGPGYRYANGYPCSDGSRNTRAVGGYHPNAFGLYDMLGNVWEWMEDCYEPSYRDAPDNGAARTAADCGKRVLRGGSWIDEPDDIRSAERIKSDPGNWGTVSGFRIARAL